MSHGLDRPARPPAARPAAPTPRDAPSLAREMEDRLQRALRLVLGITGLLIAAGLAGYAWTDRVYSRILAETSASEAQAVALNAAAVAEVLHTRAYLITGDEQSLTSRALAARDFEQAYSALHNQQERLPEAAVQTLEELRALHTEYAQLADELVALRGTGEREAAVALFDQRSDPLVLRLLATRQRLRTQMQAVSLAASQAYSRRTAQIIGLIAASLVVGLVGGLGWVQRQVARPLTALHYLERALLDTMQTPSTRAVRLPQSLTSEGYPILSAYNALAERLAETASARLEFAARLAHDLRSPLATISGYAALVEAQLAPTGKVEPITYARVIEEQAQRMLRMLAQMVMMAQLEEGKLQVLRAPLRLGSFLRLVVDELAVHHQRNIRLDDEMLTQLVEADAGLLRELLANLVDNAVKYSPSDSEIRVRAQATPQPGWVQIQVMDHGSGIEAADVAGLFRPFARLYNKAAGGSAGSGLGLYLAREIAERHGGTVELLSRPGEGTTACVSLPLFPAV